MSCIVLYSLLVKYINNLVSRNIVGTLAKMLALGKSDTKYSHKNVSVLLFTVHFVYSTFCLHNMALFANNLKEYYEIVGESRPLSAFFPTHADLITEMHFYS